MTHTGGKVHAAVSRQRERTKSAVLMKMTDAKGSEVGVRDRLGDDITRSRSSIIALHYSNKGLCHASYTVVPIVELYYPP